MSYRDMIVCMFRSRSSDGTGLLPLTGQQIGATLIDEIKNTTPESAVSEKEPTLF
jgi:hypothetical protein